MSESAIEAKIDRVDEALLWLGREAGDLAARALAGVPDDLAALESLAERLEALLADTRGKGSSPAAAGR